VSFGPKVRIQEERPRSMRRCPPGRIGIPGEWPAEESQIASFAAKRPDEQHRQDSFNDPCAPWL